MPIIVGFGPTMEFQTVLSCLLACFNIFIFLAQYYDVRRVYRTINIMIYNKLMCKSIDCFDFTSYSWNLYHISWKKMILYKKKRYSRTGGWYIDNTSFQKHLWSCGISKLKKHILSIKVITQLSSSVKRQLLKKDPPLGKIKPYDEDDTCFIRYVLIQ